MCRVENRKRCAGGTIWMGKTRQVKEDAEAVKRLRSCGAVLAGKTNMHELGMGTTGINPHYGYVDKSLE
jgi:Asp-tRNA(Asn)/Glu-tRNA(Gln) amidotransferase A subunit family amidase